MGGSRRLQGGGDMPIPRFCYLHASTVYSTGSTRYVVQKICAICCSCVFIKSMKTFLNQVGIASILARTKFAR